MQLPGYGTTCLVVRWSGGRPNQVDLDQAEGVAFVEVPAEQFDRWERDDRQAIGTPRRTALELSRRRPQLAECASGGVEVRRKPSSRGR